MASSSPWSPPSAVSTANAPAAIGPYSQAIKAGGLLFVSGQVGLDPASGTMVSGGVQAETAQVLRNLQAILEAAGTSLQSVVKTTVYLADLNDFEAMNAIYREAFPAPSPARATVEVSRLPRDARVEIDAIAAV